MTKENKPKNGFFNNFLEYGGCLTVLIILVVIVYIVSSFLEDLAVAILGEKIVNKIGDFFGIFWILLIVSSYFNRLLQSFDLLFKRIEYLQKTVNSLKETIKEEKND